MSQNSTEARFPMRLFWGALLSGLYFLFLRPQLLRWGARLGESQRRLPGDDMIENPNIQATRAIDIDAPPAAVWPWLAQMGRDRTGLYSFDVLDNNGIPSAMYIRKDLPAPQPGMSLDLGLKILALQPERMLLLGGNDIPGLFGSSIDVSVLYLLEQKSDGSTRLLMRLRGHAYGPNGLLFNLLLEPIDFIMAYRQLNGLKARAETMAHLQMAVPKEHEISLN